MFAFPIERMVRILSQATILYFRVESNAVKANEIIREVNKVACLCVMSLSLHVRYTDMSENARGMLPL